MHAMCYVKFNDEMDAMYPEYDPPIDFDLVPSLVGAAFRDLAVEVDAETETEAEYDFCIRNLGEECECYS